MHTQVFRQPAWIFDFPDILIAPDAAALNDAACWEQVCVFLPQFIGHLTALNGIDPSYRVEDICAAMLHIIAASNEVLVQGTCPCFRSLAQ